MLTTLPSFLSLSGAGWGSETIETQGQTSLVPRLSLRANTLQAMESWAGPRNEARVRPYMINYHTQDLNPTFTIVRTAINVVWHSLPQQMFCHWAVSFQLILIQDMRWPSHDAGMHPVYCMHDHDSLYCCQYKHFIQPHGWVYASTCATQYTDAPQSEFAVTIMNFMHAQQFSEKSHNSLSMWLKYACASNM